MNVSHKLNKKIFLAKKKIINGWIHIDSITSAKVMASNKFDSITIDLQHGMFSFEKCRDIIQTISIYNVFTIVRVPTNDIGVINKVIDAGAYGVICPLINTSDECKNFLSACYYPPKGKRSFGPTLASMDKNNYFSNSNSEIMSSIMIETKESVINLNDILKNKSLDMLYVGPYDLSISYGVSPEKVFNTKKRVDLYFEVLKKAKMMKKKVAIHCSDAKVANFFLKNGFDMVTIATDLSILNMGINQELNLIRKY